MKREVINTATKKYDLEMIKDLVRTHLAALQCDPEFLSLFQEASALKAHSDVTSLNVYARHRLSEENQDLKKMQTLVSELIQHNFELQSQLYKSIITLMRCKALEEGDQTLAKTLPPLLEIDSLIVYLEKSNFPANFESLKPVPKGFSESFLGYASSLLGKITEKYQKLYTFDEKQDLKSQALIRLDFGDYQGLLVLASKNEASFSSETGTELLNFFARFIEQYLRQWLN